MRIDLNDRADSRKQKIYRAMFIKQIQLSNFQVIKEFDANFEGNVYFVTGDNELGKSTLLKAIGVMLTGNRDAVLKNGEEKGFAKMVIGDDGENYEVELKFTKANPRGSLSIKSQTTGMRSDNVSMLQKIFGYQDFDAVEFSRWSESADGRRRQIEVVKSLLPESVRNRIVEIDKEVEKIKDTRKGDNATVKSYDALITNARKELKPGDVDKYKEPIKIDDLMQTQKEEAQLIEKAKVIREKKAERQTQLDNIPARIEAADKTMKDAEDEYKRIITEAKKTLDNAKTTHKETIATIDSDKKDYEKRIANADEWLAGYEKENPETTDTATRVKEAEEHNRIHGIVAKYNDVVAEQKKAQKRVETHETKLTELGKEREKLINDSKLPIEGLTFTEDGLELNGVPFVAGKVSDSQIMEIAAKLIICSNPTVKVFRIARGESLGQKRLESLIDLAQKSGYQGFIEQVVRGQNDMVVEQYTEQ